MSAVIVVAVVAAVVTLRRRGVTARVVALPRRPVVRPGGRPQQGWSGSSWWRPHRDDLLLGAAVSVVVAAAGGAQPVAAAAGIVVGLAVVAGRHRTRSHRSAVEAAAAVPDVLDALSRSLRAGGSIRQAVADVALVAPPPHDTALADVAAAAASGRSLSSALKLWPAHLALPSVVFAVAVLHLCLEVGGPSAPTIDRAAAAIRDRLAVDRERDALTSQARLSALVVVAAPVAFGLLPDGGGGSVAGILFASPLGWSCLGSALVLDALGWWWMTRLTRPAVDAVTRAVPR